MFKPGINEFDFTLGNENPLAELTIQSKVVLSAPKGTIFNFVVFNHNLREFYITRTNDVRTHLNRWFKLHNEGVSRGIPDSVFYSMTDQCLTNTCIAVTIDLDKTMTILSELEKSGWKQLSKEREQTRLKTKPSSLYKIVDDTTGFTRYTLSAHKELGRVMTNARVTAATLLGGKKLRGIAASDIICGEVERIVKNNLYFKVKTTQVYRISEKDIGNIHDKEFSKQLANMNDLALSDWLSGPYVKSLISREGVLNREA